MDFCSGYAKGCGNNHSPGSDLGRKEQKITMQPASIEQISDQVIVIKWNDGVELIYFAEKTRSACPCATCRDEREASEKSKNPFKILKHNPQEIAFSEWEMIGRYAVRFTFNDNHKTGIYTYEYLRQIGESA